MKKTNIYASDEFGGTCSGRYSPTNAQGGRLRYATDVSFRIYPAGLPPRYSVARTWVPLSTYSLQSQISARLALATVGSTNLRNRGIYLQTIFIAPGESIFLRSLRSVALLL